MSINKFDLCIRYLVLVFISVFFGSSIVVAQTAIEEVIITAQKREESLQDVPIAVNALTGDQLSQFAIASTDDMLRMFPNLSLKAGSAVNSGFSIRGVGTDNYHSTAQQAVGQYMDEVSLVAPFTGQFALFDLERVEVLRGPQNTLYGRNTTGGAVNMISRRPEVGGEVNGFGRVNVGNEGRLDFEGAVGIPIGETMAVRAAIQTQNRDGVFNSIETGDELGEIERHSGRVQLAWEPTDRLSILLNGHLGFSRGKRQPFTGVGQFNPDGVTQCSTLGQGSKMFDRPNNCVAPNAFGALVNVSTNDWNDVHDAGPTNNDANLRGGFLRIAYEFEHFTLTSLTSYDRAEVRHSENTGGTGPAGFFPGQDSQYDVWSQEVRLASSDDGRLRWIAGGFYSFEEDVLGLMIRNGIPGTPPFTVVPSTQVDQQVEIISGYARVEFDLMDKLTLNGGLRVTDDQKDGRSVARVVAGTATGAPGPRAPDDFYYSLSLLQNLTAGAAAAGIGCPGALPCQSPPLLISQSITEVTGNAGLSYNFTDDIMGYFTWSRGFKSGAFDTRALAVFNGSGTVPVKPEFLTSFEGGVKASFMDNSLQLNASIFQYFWDDLQIFDSDANGIPTFLNIPETEIFGFEAEVKWVPADGWYVQAGLGILSSEMKDIGILSGPVQGSELNEVPDVTFNGLIIKDFKVGNGVLSLQTDFRYVDEYFTTLDENPELVMEDTFYINARLSYTFGSEEQYEVAIWGENLTEEKTCITMTNLPGLTQTYNCLQNPGMAFYGGSVQVNF